MQMQRIKDYNEDVRNKEESVDVTDKLSEDLCYISSHILVAVIKVF